MKELKINTIKNISKNRGFSEVRIRFIVLTAIIAIVLAKPSIGFVGSTLVVLLFTLFVVKKMSQSLENNLGYRLQQKPVQHRKAPKLANAKIIKQSQPNVNFSLNPNALGEFIQRASMPINRI